MRYFFDLIDGVSFPDIQGLELPDDEVALAEARRRATHHNGAKARNAHTGHCRIRVRDDRGRVVADVPI
jgi:hypothetical protein